MNPASRRNVAAHCFVRALYYALIAYASWLSMMAVHESGHVLHAWLSGGHVQRVVLPFWGFSRTDVFPNPNPVFVTWGGPLWGCIWPSLVLIILAIMKRRIWSPLRFFVGFCLVANGAYLGAGWGMRAGDARDLVMMGTPRVELLLFGAVTTSMGLYILHRLGATRQLWQ